MYTKPIVYKVFSYFLAVAAVLGAGALCYCFFASASSIFSSFEFLDIVHVLALIVGLAAIVWFGLLGFTMMYTFADMVDHELKDDGTIFKPKFAFPAKVYSTSGSIVFYAVLMIDIIALIYLIISQSIDKGAFLVIPVVDLLVVAVVTFFIHVLFNARYGSFAAVLEIKGTDDPRIPQMNKLKENNPNTLRSFCGILFVICAITLVVMIVSIFAFSDEVLKETTDHNLTVKEDGYYHVAFRPDGSGEDNWLADKCVSLTKTEAPAEPATEDEPAVDDTVYYVVGSFNDWTISDEYKLTAEESGSKVYKGVFDITAADTFQIVSVTAGAVDTLSVDADGKYVVSIGADGTVTVAAEGEATPDEASPDEASPDEATSDEAAPSKGKRETYYIVGSFSDWKIDNKYKLTVVENAAGGIEEYEGTFAINACDEFKLVSSKNGEITKWYPESEYTHHKGLAIILIIIEGLLAIIAMAIFGCFFDNLAKMQEKYMIKYKLI